MCNLILCPKMLLLNVECNPNKVVEVTEPLIAKSKTIQIESNECMQFELCRNGCS